MQLLLDHIALVTTSNVCDGCVMGVLAVLASRRFSALQCAETKVRFTRLLDSWRRSLREMARGDSAVFDADALAQLKRCEALMTRCGVDARADVEPRSTTLSPIDGAREALTSAWTVAEVGQSAVVRAARQMGFWGAVVHLPTAKTAGDPFSVLGLNHAAEQAAAWVELLQDWHPVPDSSTVRDGNATVSAVRLLQSDHFILSDAQERIAAALRDAGMAPQKYIAQELLVEVFAKKWSRCLLQSSQDKEGHKKVVGDITRALQMTRAILQSAFETEYEAAEGGWRSGLSGDGFRLASRLDNRVTVGIALLNKLPFAGHFVSSALGAALKPPLQWQHYSSCTGRKLMEYAEFVDHCARRVFEEYTAVDGAEGEGADAETRTTVNKLYAVCAEVVALLALAGVENLAGVVASSLRGLLRCVHNMPSTSAVDGTAMVALVAEIDR